MRIICISDLHGHLPQLPEGDLILLAGDICPDYDQHRWLFGEFAAWAERQPAFIIAVWGNHDFIGEKLGEPLMNNVAFVHDSIVNYQGLSIYGTPWSHWTADWCRQWAFMRKDAAHHKIPPVDIIVSHGPPYGIGDRCEDGDRAGSHALREDIERVQPKLVVCGHIHEDRGIFVKGLHQGCPTVINASHVDLRYRPIHDSIVWDIDE